MDKNEKIKILAWAKKHGMSTEPIDSFTPLCDCRLHRLGDFLDILIDEEYRICFECCGPMRQVQLPAAFPNEAYECKKCKITVITYRE